MTQKALPIRTAKLFALKMLLVMVILVLSVIALNFFADPYRLFTKASHEDVDQYKPRPQKYQQQIRTAVAKKFPSDILILGNSTLEIGINPDDPQLAQLGLSIYNHAIAGHNLHEVSLGLDDIFAVWKPKHVLINVSLADFIYSKEIEKKRVSMTTEGDLRVKALFSIDTVLDALRYLTMNFRPNIETITARGHNPMNVIESGAKRTGYKQLFDVNESRVTEMMRKYQGGNGVDPSDKSISISDYSKLLKKLIDADIPVTVIVSPLHKSYQQGLRKYSLLDTQHRWKTLLVDISKNLNQSGKIRIMDFGCADKWLNEPVPARTEKTTSMSYYWDAEHFKANVGAEIVKELFDNRPELEAGPKLKQGVDLLKYGVEGQTKKCELISRQP
jgi:hypothetical protein